MPVARGEKVAREKRRGRLAVFASPGKRKLASTRAVRWRLPSSRGAVGRQGRPAATRRSRGEKAAPYGPLVCFVARGSSQ